MARLEAARAQLYDTEKVGADTMQHLAKQRETIQKARDNVSSRLSFVEFLLSFCFMNLLLVHLHHLHPSTCFA